MAEQLFTLRKENLPFLLGGTGDLQIRVPEVNPAGLLPKGTSQLLDLQFGTPGAGKFEFGTALAPKLSVSAGARFQIRAIWNADNPADRQLLEAFGLGSFFRDNPEAVLLYLDSGIEGAAGLSGKFQYSVLKAGMSVQAGTDVRFRFLRPSRVDVPVAALAADLAQAIRLPSLVDKPLQPGEVIAFEYGGQLQVGAQVGLSYQVAGTSAFAVNDLQLSERFRLATTATLGLAASVAGRFSIEVRRSETVGPEWARVVVRKAKSSSLNIAADVRVEAGGELKGLPGTPNEFLSAALGVHAKSWLSLMRSAQEWTDFETVRSRLDGLAKDFVERWSGKALDQLQANEELQGLLSRFSKAIASVDQLEERAVSLFDAYFDRLTDLESRLQNLLAPAFKFEQLSGKVDPELWRVLNQLTDGDPLGWIARQTGLTELQARARQTLELIQSEAHETLRSVIALSKREFGLETLLTELRKVDTVEELREIADQRVGRFADRLIGVALKELDESDLKKGLDRIKAALQSVEEFEKRMYARLLGAAKHSFSFGLHAEYNRLREQDSLVDVSIHLGSEEGRRMLSSAARGDFEPVLNSTDTQLARVHNAVLRSKLTKETRFDIHIAGWQREGRYSGFDRVLLETEQRVVDSGNGGVIVFTELEFRKEKERKRQKERIYTDFLVRLLGETKSPGKFNKRTHQYLIDSLKGMSASYRILLEDDQTTAEELSYYLAFARDFGLVQAGVDIEAVRPLLPSQTVHGRESFGKVHADYRVRYSESTLERLLRVKFDAAAEALVRKVMRNIIVGSYTTSRHVHLHDIGWAYAAPATHSLFRELGPAAFTNVSGTRDLQTGGLSVAGHTSPAMARLQRTQLLVLSTLIQVENRMLEGLKLLFTELAKTGDIDASQLGRAGQILGNALKDFDQFDEDDNTAFAIFDRLVAAVDNAPGTRLSSLELVSQVNVDGQMREVRKVFTSDMNTGLPAASAATVVA